MDDDVFDVHVSANLVVGRVCDEVGVKSPMVPPRLAAKGGVVASRQISPIATNNESDEDELLPVYGGSQGVGFHYVWGLEIHGGLGEGIR